MAADLVLAGRSESTRKSYLRCARAFVKHFMRSPEDLGEAEVRSYLLHLRARKLSVGHDLKHLAALKVLFKALRRPEVTANIPWPRMPRRRPDIPTREQVAVVLAAASSPYWRAFLTTAYAGGLRRMEVAALRVQDVDSKAGLLRIACGKGGKAREVMLDPTLLAVFRAHWREQNLVGPWLFPARTRRGAWADRAGRRPTWLTCATPMATSGYAGCGKSARPV